VSQNSKRKRDAKKKITIKKINKKLSSSVNKYNKVVNLYFDESGNTGGNLIDADQPIFTLAGTDCSDSDAESLLEIVSARSQGEIHFKRLKRRKPGQDGIIRLLSDVRVNATSFSVNVYHKKYLLMTKIVDYLVEPMMAIAGKNFYEGGMNIAMVNMYYTCFPVFCGEESVESIYQAFMNLIKENNDNTVSAFRETLISARDLCSNEDFKSDINFLCHTNSVISDFTSNLDKSDLDPAIPAFFSQCVYWGELYSKGFHVRHDDSQTLEQRQHLLKMFMDWTDKKVTVGHDRRQFSLPLKSKSIDFKNSADYSQLQVADVVASSVAYWVSCKLSGNVEDYFFKRLDELSKKLTSLISSHSIWPTHNITPQELGTEYHGGTNPVDAVAEFIKNKV
jgi:hypothetical protein